MPTQVSRPPSADPLRSPRASVDKFPSSGHHDSLHHPPCDSRAKYNSQHREALRLALGSILAPKRPSMPGSRSSSGTTTPAYSFSGSSGTYTPATPPVMPYTPSLDVNNSQEHLWTRHHLPHPHYHPSHPSSKLARVEPLTDAPGTEAPSSIPTSTTPRHSPPPPLFRSLSHNPSNPPSSRTSPRLLPITPPPAHPPPAITATDSADLGSITQFAPVSPIATNDEDRRKISAENRVPPPSVLAPGDVPLLSSAPATYGRGSPDQVLCQQHPSGTGSSGPGTPRAKFIQTLQSKSAWDALIHGSFS